MTDRAFWAIAIGAAPAAQLGLVVGQLAGAPTWMGTPGWFAVLALEALLLWRLADPALAGPAVRARRVGLGLLVSVVAAIVIGAVLLTVILMIAFGADG